VYWGRRLSITSFRAGTLLLWGGCAVSLLGLVCAELYIRHVLMPRVTANDSSLWGWGPDGASSYILLGNVAFLIFPLSIVWSGVCLYFRRQTEANLSCLAAAAAFGLCLGCIAQSSYFMD